MDEGACYAELVGWLHPDGLACPRCGARDDLGIPRRHRAPVPDYRGAACRRVFHALTGTAPQATKRRPVALVLILRGFAQGASTAQLARELGCDRGELLDLRHRLQHLAWRPRGQVRPDDPVVEADEMDRNAGEERHAVGMLTIRQSLAQLKGKFVLKEPKSRRSRRTIKLPAFVVEAFCIHRDGMVKKGNMETPVFCTKSGTYIGRSKLTRQVFRPVLKAAGLPQVRLHGLRHPHASALLRDGASIKAVSQRLGHSTVELTLRDYYHLFPDADEALASQAGQLFG